ncbi:MAG TPA: WYL domain-containing protein [Chitinophagaceae bacterium]|nr:WYL domain-containing protein [Chitinophagaceae bacterium]
MADYQIIKRLEIIMYLLKSFPNRNKKELIRRLQEDYDLNITSRTLERDFKMLENDFNIQVIYNRAENGYNIKEQDDDQVINFLQFVGRIYIGELLREGLKEFNNLKEFIKLEDYSGFEGIHWIKTLLSAIKNKLEIRFQHTNYQKETLKSYILSPLQLREYQGRWYIIGIPKDESQIKTFGLDRIAKLQILGLSTIHFNDYQKQLSKFNHIVGLNYDASKDKELIELAVKPSQYKYLKTLPIHSSQTFEEKLSDGRIKISLFLLPNYELIMELLKLGNQIEILHPKTLREKIKDILEKNLKQY